MGRSALEFDATFDTIDTPAQNAVADPEKVTAASQAMMDASMGVSPVIDAPHENGVLLAHGVKHDGVLLRDAEVRELNGEDEEALAKVGGNFLRFFDTIVGRGTVSIGGVPMSKEFGDELLVGDREDLILAIRRATFGPVLDIEDFECPVCLLKSDLSVDLNSVPHVELDEPDDILRPIELKHGHVAEVRFVNGADQRAIYANQNATPAESNTVLLARCIVSFDGETVSIPGGARATGLVKKLPMPDRMKILKHLAEHAPGPRFDRIEYTHDACGSVIKLPLGLGDMFLGL